SADAGRQVLEEWRKFSIDLLRFVADIEADPCIKSVGRNDPVESGIIELRFLDSANNHFGEQTSVPLPIGNGFLVLGPGHQKIASRLHREAAHDRTIRAV